MIDRTDEATKAGSGAPALHRAPVERTPALAGCTFALAHDWLVGMRGGEWVLDRLARLFGPTDLYTLVSDGRPLTDAISACRVHTSPLQRLPGAAGALRRWYFPLMPWAVERLHVAPCDLLVSTSSAVMKSIRPPDAPPDGTPHLCYCHSPARYAWDQTGDYAHGRLGGVRLLGLRAVKRRFQEWDRRTAARVTRFLANSHHTADRIRRCYGREAHVVYPPVRTDFFSRDPAVQREDWLLLVAALEPYKRADIAITAAATAGFHLKVVGSGSQESALRRTARPTVEFLGRVDDAALRDLYRRARALIFPQIEDFGIVAVEAQATGCPVLAFAGGGALESVAEDAGMFFAEQTPLAVIDAMRGLDRLRVDAAACRRSAERFSAARFDAAILAHVTDMVSTRAAPAAPFPAGPVG